MADLTRRDLFKAAGVTAAALGANSLGEPASALFSSPARAATTPLWNHDPASPIGPPHWDAIGYPTCGAGMDQSPVDIRTAQVAAFHGPPLLLRYQRADLGIENTGHVVEVPTPAGVNDTARIAGTRYQLVQYHFHAPSEHAINGRLADLEAHFVHTNAQGATAVVGVLFTIGDDPNPLLDRILLAAPATAGEEVTAGKASPAQLFGHICDVAATRSGLVAVNSFYSYAGSLTTPGCTESVLWSVLAHRGHVSRPALVRFHHLIARFPNYNGYPNNNRPVQPLNGRTIELRRGDRD